MEFKAIRLEVPENANIILGHSHFIKTVEDLYEAIVNTVPQMKFGIAFSEASGACLIRVDGNDPELKAVATRNVQALASGHCFLIAMRDGYPINILGRILGVIDGSSPKGVETETDAEWRHGLLRKIGYKR